MFATVRVAAIAVAALLTGCSTAGPDVPGGPPEIHAAWTSCAAEVLSRPKPAGIFLIGGSDTVPLTLPRLPGDFEPVTAIVCKQDQRAGTDGGVNLVLDEARTERISGLVAALRLPDQRRTSGECLSDLPGIPSFYLLDAGGRRLRPGVPADVCGKLRIEVRDAVAALKVTVVASTVIGQTETVEAVRAGCRQREPDMVAAFGQTPQTGLADLPPASGGIRTCYYTVSPAEQANDQPTGSYTRGGSLHADRWGPIRAAFPAAGQVPACAARASRFVLLEAVLRDGSTPTIAVELDGCMRVLVTPAQGGGTLLQGDRAMIDLLAA